MTRNERRSQRRAERFELVLQHIEAHSSERLDIATLADMARISPYHFHRVFSSYVGEPVSRFVRRLRLEKAARLILFGCASITQAAAEAGYATSAAFTRAFRRHFGASPKKLVKDLVSRRPGISASGRRLPDGPEFRRLPPMTLTGIQRLGSYDRAPFEAWQALHEFLSERGNGCNGLARIGIPLDWPEITPAKLRRYEACVAADVAPEGRAFRKQIGGGTYAVFRHRGAHASLQDAHEAIFWYWYPQSGVTLGEGAAFHRFLDAACDPADASDASTEIYIPVASDSVAARQA